MLPTGTSFSCNDGNVTYAKVTKDDGAVEVTVVLSGTAEGNDAITEDALSLAGARPMRRLVFAKMGRGGVVYSGFSYM